MSSLPSASNPPDGGILFDIEEHAGHAVREFLSACEKLKEEGISLNYNSEVIKRLSTTPICQANSIDSFYQLHKTLRASATEFDSLIITLAQHPEIMKQTTLEGEKISEIIAARIILAGTPPENVLNEIKNAPHASAQLIKEINTYAKTYFQREKPMLQRCWKAAEAYAKQNAVNGVLQYNDEKMVVFMATEEKLTGNIKKDLQNIACIYSDILLEFPLPPYNISTLQKGFRDAFNHNTPSDQRFSTVQSVNRMMSMFSSNAIN